MTDPEPDPEPDLTGLLATPADLSRVALGTVDEATAIDLLGRASEIVRGYCHWAIDERDYDLLLDGTNASVLLLPAKQVTAVASVTADGTTLADGIDYDWSASGVLERLDGSWPRRRRSVAVAFTAGYDPVPRDVVAVVTGLTARVLSTKGGWVQQRIGSLSLGQSLTAGGGLDKYDQAILDRYRLP